MIKKSKALAVLGAVALLFSAVVPPQPVRADYAVIQKQLAITSTTVTPANGLTLLPLTGQSSCTVEIIGTAAGTTQVLQNGTWTNVDSVQPSGTGAASPTVSGPGTFIANCGGMQGYQFVPTSVTGTATISVLANGGVSRILGAGVNGGRTIVAGSGPITVTNAGNTATVSLTDPLPVLYGGTGATALPAGCLQSNGTVVTSIGSSCGTGSGTITAVTGTGNIDVTAGATPVVSITNSPTFTGNETLGISGRYSDGGSGASLLDINNGLTGGFTQIGTYNNSANFVNGVGGQLLGIGLSMTAPEVVIDTAGDVSSAGSFYSAALTSGQCLSAGASGKIQSSGTTCGGSFTSITGTAPITVTSGASPVVSCSTCLTGLTAGSNVFVGTGPSPGVAVTNAPSFTGQLSAANLKDTALTSGDCLTSTAGVITSTSTACAGGPVGSLTAGSNIVLTSPSPNVINVAVTAAPTFSNVTDSALTAGHCLQASTGGLLAVTGGACATVGLLYGNTTASFIMPAVGSSVTVATNLAASADPYMPVTISDGSSNVVSGVYSNAGGTFTTKAIILGAAGNSLVPGSWIYTGSGTYGTGNGTVTGLTAGNDIVVGTGPTPAVAVTNAPSFTGPLSALTIAGTGLTTGECVQASSLGVLTTQPGGPCVTGIVAGANIVVSGSDPTPGVAVTAAPSFTNEQISNHIALGTAGTDPSGGLGQIIFANASGYQTQLTYMFPTQSDPVNTITPAIMGWGSNTTAFFAEDTSGNVGIPGVMHATSFTGAGTGLTGVVTTVSGTGNTSSTGGTTPTVSITAAPSFSQVYDTGLTNATCVAVSSSGILVSAEIQCPGSKVSASFVIPAVGSTVAITIGNGRTWPVNLLHVNISDGTNSMAGVITSGATSTTLTVENVGMWAGAVGNTMTTSAIIEPGSAFVPAPVFTNITDSSLLQNRCVQSSTLFALGSSPAGCPVGRTNATFVIPAVGASVSVTANANAYFITYNNTPIVIVDGTNTMSGLVTAGAGTGTITVTNTGVIAGAVGNTMASGAMMHPGPDGSALINNTQAGTRLNGLHVESNPSLSVGTATTATFTYGSTFTAAPTCTVSTVGALAPTMSINATPGTSSAVVYNSGTSGTASISCIGW